MTLLSRFSLFHCTPRRPPSPPILPLKRSGTPFFSVDRTLLNEASSFRSPSSPGDAVCPLTSFPSVEKHYSLSLLVCVGLPARHCFSVPIAECSFPPPFLGSTFSGHGGFLSLLSHLSFRNGLPPARGFLFLRASFLFLSRGLSPLFLIALSSSLPFPPRCFSILASLPEKEPPPVNSLFHRMSEKAHPFPGELLLSFQTRRGDGSLFRGGLRFSLEPLPSSYEKHLRISKLDAALSLTLMMWRTFFFGYIVLQVGGEFFRRPLR